MAKHSGNDPSLILSEHEETVVLRYLHGASVCMGLTEPNSSEINGQAALDIIEHYSIPDGDIIQLKEDLEDQLAAIEKVATDRGSSTARFIGSTINNLKLTNVNAEKIKSSLANLNTFVHQTEPVPKPPASHEHLSKLEAFRGQILSRHITAGALFADMDADKSNRVSFGEFARGIAMIGIRPLPNNREMHALFNSFDENSDGFLSWEEVLSKLKLSEAEEAARKEEENAFRGATIPKVEVKEDKERMEKNVKDLRHQLLRRHATAGQIFTEMDTDRGGRISYFEFERGIAMIGIRPVPDKKVMTALFNSFDLDGDRFITWNELVESLEKSVADEALKLHERHYTIHTEGSVASHRGKNSQLYKTRQAYRADQLYDDVMESLQVSRMETHIPTTNNNNGSMDNFMAKLGVIDDNASRKKTPKKKSALSDSKQREKAEKEERKRAKRERKERRRREKNNGLNVNDLSAISDATSATEDPSVGGGASDGRRRTVVINEEANTITAIEAVRRPSVLHKQSYSLDDEFQKLHGQKKEVSEKHTRKRVEQMIMLNRKAELQEEMLEEIHEQVFGADLKPTAKAQHDVCKRLSKPLPKNVYEKPPTPPPSNSNIRGRQRPNPELEAPKVEVAKRSEEEVSAWVLRQAVLAKKAEADKKSKLDGEVAEMRNRRFTLSEASEGMLSGYRSSSPESKERKGDTDILEQLYKDGLKIVEKKKKKPPKSPYSHKPSLHLENEVTQKILEDMPRRKDSFMLEIPKPPPPEKLDQKPKIPEESLRIVANDRGYNAKAREIQRVESWVAKSVSFREEKQQLAAASSKRQDYNPKMSYIIDSPRRKSKEAILAQQEIALQSEQKKIL
jgi:Ca2+-binding EF-hand superfamily protein